MKRILFFLIFCLQLNSSEAQENELYVVDLIYKWIDSLGATPLELTEASTMRSYQGTLNANLLQLDLNTPSNLCRPDITFTKRINVSAIGSSTSYPARTSIKVGKLVSGKFVPTECSGVLVGDRFVLTALHCIDLGKPPTFLPYYKYDSIYIAPAFDNGILPPGVPFTRVQKVYYLKYKSIPDLALIELEAPIGNVVGWMGMGYAKDEFFHGKNFHKFATPQWPTTPANNFNGDTMYYYYGKVDYIDSTLSGTTFYHILYGNVLGVKNYDMIPCGIGGGASGSTLFYTNNVDTFTTYGALSTGFSLMHSRITNRIFSAFKRVINNPYITSIPNMGRVSNDFSVYPVPTEHTLTIKNKSSWNKGTFSVFNIDGNVFLSGQLKHPEFSLDVSKLNSGFYILKIFTDKKESVYKFIKN